MPRIFFRKITPRHDTLRSHWALRPFARFFGDPRLWSLQRRTVTPAFGVGLAISFIPLPIHLPLGVLIAILCRLHIPTMLLSLMLVNPLTLVPAYLLAYEVGVLVTGYPHVVFHFELSWDWLQRGLGPMWKPFLVGLAITGTSLGLLSYGLIDILWRYTTRKRYRERPGAASK